MLQLSLGCLKISRERGIAHHCKRRQCSGGPARGDIAGIMQAQHDPTLGEGTCLPEDLRLVCRAQVALKELPWMPRRRRVRSGTSCAFLPHHSAAAAPSTPWQDPPVFRRPIRLARRTRRSMGISRERTAVQSSGQRKRRYAERLLARRRTARSYARLLLRPPLVRPRVLARNQSRVVAAAKRSGRSARDPNNESPHPSWRRRARRALQAIGREIRP